MKHPRFKVEDGVFTMSIPVGDCSKCSDEHEKDDCAKYIGEGQEHFKPLFGDHDVDFEDICNVHCKTDWVCTRTPGHDGPHEGVSSTTNAVARWTNKDSEGVL